LVLAKKQAVGAEWDVPDYANAQPQQTNNRKPRQRQKTSPTARLVLGISLIALVFLTGISFTWLQAYKAQLNYQLNKTKAEIQALQTANQRMEVEIARLKSLDRIENIATSQLGMIKNSGIEYLALEKEKPAAKAVAAAPVVGGGGEKGILGRLVAAITTWNLLARG